MAARDEAERLGGTLQALGEAFPGAALWVADDGSSDATAHIAEAAGAHLARTAQPLGKGGAVTRAAREALSLQARGGTRSDDALVVLCDADLGRSAAALADLVPVLASREADVAVAAFARRVGGGLGLAVGFARWAIRRRCGLQTVAPLSGQRALRAAVLHELLPLSDGFGMEVGMTIDAVHAGYRVVEVELDLSHRATGRTPAGFAHRGRQLLDIARAYHARR